MPTIEELEAIYRELPRPPYSVPRRTPHRARHRARTVHCRAWEGLKWL